MLYPPAAVAGDLSEIDLTVVQTDALSEVEREALFGLFRMNYQRANRAFLERSLAKLGWAALAHRDGRPVGFALGETRVMDLPRLPAQVVSLAGLCCVRLEFRRRGLWVELEQRVLTAQEVPAAPRRLLCGRMAHPAAMRVMTKSPTVVPKPGQRPTAWQREVGRVIAEAYGVHGFDPETFVCLGGGQPIGYPKIAFEVEPHEWKVFESVDRDRGDALLALIWVPDAPPGW